MVWADPHEPAAEVVVRFGGGVNVITVTQVPF
jgi:hypothetical protein